MKKHLATAFVLVAALGFVASAGLAPAQQADDPKNQTIEKLSLDQADVRDALKVLFKDVKAQYTVENDVQGPVTVSLASVPFETALRNILNQVDATWRVEGGIYQISKKVATDSNPELQNVATPEAFNYPIRIPIMHADPAHILQMLRGVDNINDSPEITQQQFIGGGGAIGGGGSIGGIGGGIGGGSIGGGVGGGIGGGGIGSGGGGIGGGGGGGIGGL